ncbi:hypothetical protein OIU76_008428 [Salix suchowensis]|nr:hypothetical protein OIU76_008428 [Salix suchowensis]
MSELSSPSTATKKTHHLSSLLLSDLFLFFSFILSHPLYFSYLVFFSPYLLKLLSFLSPLFITTSLLLLALLTISPNLVNDSSHAELYGSKDLEAYKIVFETSNLGVEDHNHTVDQVTGVEQAAKDGQSACPGSTDQLSLQVHEGSTHQALGAGGGVSDQALNVKILDENSASITRSESNGRDQLINIAEGKTLGGFLHQKEEFEDLWFQKEEKEVLLKPLNVNSNKVEDRKEEQPMIRSGSKATSGQKISEAKVISVDDDGGEHYYSPKLSSRELEPNPWSPGNGGDCTSKAKDSSQTLEYSNLGSFGSMRKEKEWRRTLACKLFEERHNVDGGEGMDMLWETYESDSIKVQAKSKTKKGKKGSVEYYDDDEEDLEEERSDGQLCCLQALKFSAGKMNLGMGRPNLVKISKALKGIGWLHHVSKHSKKGHH